MYSPHSRVQLGIVGEQYPEVISLPFISAGFGHSPVNNAYGVSCTILNFNSIQSFEFLTISFSYSPLGCQNKEHDDCCFFLYSK